jgi:hypothetical protein
MQTRPNIPRADWTNHPRFATQALLLGSHANFRRISHHLVTRAEAGESTARDRTLFEMWKRAMGGHEAYEERKLYPFLARRWGISCATAEAGHTLLGVLDTAVRSAFSSGAGVAKALRAHHDTLMAHLDYEEALVIPLLLALEPAEFAAYSRAG